MKGSRRRPGRRFKPGSAWKSHVSVGDAQWTVHYAVPEGGHKAVPVSEATARRIGFNAGKREKMQC